MHTAEDMARKLNAALRNAGYNTYYLESRKKPIPMSMEAVEVSLGIPNVFPVSADGDVLVQVTEDMAKVTTDLIRVPPSRAADVVITCNGINAMISMTRFYVQSDELVVVADHDFSYSNDAFIEQIIKYLPMYRHDVRQAHSFIQATINGQL